MEHVAKTVALQIERQYGGQDRQPWEEGMPKRSEGAPNFGRAYYPGEAFATKCPTR
jgi:hypothetical protein